MIEQIKQDVEEGARIAGRKPKVFIMGYKGRCGTGAVQALERLGVTDLVKWDIEETVSIICSHDMCSARNRFLTPRFPEREDRSLSGDNRLRHFRQFDIPER